MSAFNPDSFLEQTVSGANDTVVTPVPEGEYVAQIVKYTARTIEKENEEPRVALNISWQIDGGSHPEVEATTGRDKNTVYQTVWLDLLPDQSGLDMGKGRNVGLGRLRAALNLNDPSRPFSFTQLTGQCAKVSVRHRIPTGKTDPQADVNGVAPL